MIKMVAVEIGLIADKKRLKTWTRKSEIFAVISVDLSGLLFDILTTF